MAVQYFDLYGPFDYVEGDGEAYEYTSAEESKLDSLLGETGVVRNYLNELEVTAGAGFNVKINTGAIIVNGRKGINSSIKYFNLNAQNAGTNRIDLVVARMSGTNRKMELDIVQGVASVNPVAPSLTQTDNEYELLLATLTITGGSSTFDIVDGRTYSSNASEAVQMADDNRTVNIASGTGTAIELTIPTFEIKKNKKFTFRTIAPNNGNATTININGKIVLPLYKEGTTVTPVLKSYKTYSAFLKDGLTAVFLLASAEGDALASHVLAPKTFSNGDDTGITGTMVNRNTDQNALDFIQSNGIIGVKPPTGFYSGARVNIHDADFIASNIPNNKNIFGLQGTMKNYASWNAFTVLTNASTASSRQRKLISTITLPVGTPIKLSSTCYGIVTHSSNGENYVWFSASWTPTTAGTYYYGGKGCYPSDFPDITFDNWGLVINGSIHNVGGDPSLWHQFETFNMPHGLFNANVSYYSGYYWDDAQYGSYQCVSLQGHAGVTLYPQLPQNTLDAPSSEYVSAVISCNGEAAAFTAKGAGVHPTYICMHMMLMPTFTI